VHSRPQTVAIRKGRAGDVTVVQQPVVRLVAKQTSRRPNGGAFESDDEARLAQALLYSVAPSKRYYISATELLQ